MSDTAIRVENLSKSYRIARGIQGDSLFSYKTLRESLVDAAYAPFRRLRAAFSGAAGGSRGKVKPFWALDAVSFEIKQGEVIGIIGSNGAGKSTLLKILSRITHPTRGRAVIRGRVGSLLEVGTGFHPELTGRENIYLNGAILGMKKAEISRHFDEIVAFAEIRDFLETPVKRYSSGMYVRLAFAVAAHMEPEILLIDEVLAVGDIRFQKKCLAKMSEVGAGGRTVIFVSHNMQSITRLCERAILLDEGKLARDGPAPQVVSAYISAGAGTTACRKWLGPEKAPGDDVVRLREVSVRNEKGEVSDVIDIRRPFNIELHYDVIKPGHPLSQGIFLKRHDGLVIFSTVDLSPEWDNKPRPAGSYVSAVRIPGNLLAEGMVTVRVGMGKFFPKVRRVMEDDVVAFMVTDCNEDGAARGPMGGEIEGVVRPLLPWNTKKTD